RPRLAGAAARLAMRLRATGARLPCPLLQPVDPRTGAGRPPAAAVPQPLPHDRQERHGRRAAPRPAADRRLRAAGARLRPAVGADAAARLRRGGAALARRLAEAAGDPAPPARARRAGRAAGTGARAVSSGTCEILDVGVETAPPAELLRRILGWAERGEHRRVTYVNAHVLNQSVQHPELRRSLLASDLVYCDGY